MLEHAVQLDIEPVPQRRTDEARKAILGSDVQVAFDRELPMKPTTCGILEQEIAFADRLLLHAQRQVCRDQPEVWRMTQREMHKPFRIVADARAAQTGQ